MGTLLPECKEKCAALFVVVCSGGSLACLNNALFKFNVTDQRKQVLDKSLNTQLSSGID